MIEKSKIILIIDNKTEIPAPIDKALKIDFLETPPSVTSSTWLDNRCTAGSARTINTPSKKPIIHTHTGLILAKALPSLKPLEWNPIEAAVKNNTEPMKAKI